MESSREAWEQVLASIEADMARSAALLDPAGAGREDATRPDPRDLVQGGGMPAEWMLPSAVELPPLESMPPVPVELSDRILCLRSQIISLQRELAEAMQNLPRPPRARPTLTPTEVPAYIDRRL